MTHRRVWNITAGASVTRSAGEWYRLDQVSRAEAETSHLLSCRSRSWWLHFYLIHVLSSSSRWSCLHQAASADGKPVNPRTLEPSREAWWAAAVKVFEDCLSDGLSKAGNKRAAGSHHTILFEHNYSSYSSFVPLGTKRVLRSSYFKSLFAHHTFIWCSSLSYLEFGLLTISNNWNAWSHPGALCLVMRVLSLSIHA